MQLTNSTVISQGNSRVYDSKEPPQPDAKLKKEMHRLNLSQNDENQNLSQYGLVIRSAKSSAGDLHSGHLINKGAPGSDSI